MLENVMDLLILRAKDCYGQRDVCSAIIYHMNSDSHFSTTITKEVEWENIDRLVGIIICHLPKTFADLHLGLHCIVIDHNPFDLHWSCNCKEYYKLNMCKDILCVHNLIRRIDMMFEPNKLSHNKKNDRKK